MGPKVGEFGMEASVNAIVVTMEDGYYLVDSEPHVENVEPLPQVRPEAAAAIDSYTFGMLLAIIVTQKEASALHHDVQALVAKGDEILARQQTSSDLRDQAAISALRQEDLQRSIERGTRAVEDLRSQLANLRTTSTADRKQLHAEWASNDAAMDSLDARSASLGDQPRSLEDLQRCIKVRQRSLILGVASIYPITRDPSPPINSHNNKTLLSIRGIRLPDSEFVGHDDDTIATALGFVSHLLSMIALYLHLPLRYPLRCMSSRSSISDAVSEHYAGSKVFPLYARGVERLRFDYAVFLLNKNIEQTMNHLHLTVSNLRHTLANLRAVIEAVRAWDCGEPAQDDESTSPRTAGQVDGREDGGLAVPTVNAFLTGIGQMDVNGEALGAD
ncbi:hypothetical protein HKX48_003202 [Thoreauomyces humboldtii]|nr:hypothetical protein HKX48_003202 [Thoreauomyces humboldtii]